MSQLKTNDFLTRVYPLQAFTTKSDIGRTVIQRFAKPFTFLLFLLNCKSCKKILHFVSCDLWPLFSIVYILYFLKALLLIYFLEWFGTNKDSNTIIICHSEKSEEETLGCFNFYHISMNNSYPNLDSPLQKSDWNYVFLKVKVKHETLAWW